MTKLIPLSIVILTKNEEKNIIDCLEGVLFASDILIIDDYSTDRTLEIVKSLKKENIRVVQHSLSGNFSKQRNFGIEKAKESWVMFLDADERVTKELLEEIAEAIKDKSISGLSVNRVDILWGRILKHGETGDIRLVRIAKKGFGLWKSDVHEIWDVGGKVKNLRNELHHYPHQTVREFLDKINLYSTIRAKELYGGDQKVGAFSIVLYPKLKFLLNYLLKFGFLDGVQGLIVALMMSFHSFLVRAKLWLLYQKKE